MCFLLLALFLAVPVASQPSLRMPLDCALGETCFIQHYFDVDPSEAARDRAGGMLTYDGHDGTDFRVADLQAMVEGVAVLAPAAGRIVRLRDGMADGRIERREDVAGQECGNGVAIDHGEGWETTLCHLARNSIRVAPGERVASGQLIGRIGLSGATQFPHVHFTVRRDGIPLDPFAEGLWSDPPPYEAGGLLAAGFAEAVPEFEAVKAGVAGSPTLPTDAPALVLWASLYGGRTGDTIRLRIAGPEGDEIFLHETILEATQIELFRAAGRRRAGGTWPEGFYSGRATLLREGREIDRLDTNVLVLRN